MRVHANRLVSTAEIAAAARRLQAQGYPLDWQATATGSPIPHLVAGTLGTWSHPDHLTRVITLTRQLGEAMATPAPGLTQEQIDQAAKDAASAGYYPPAAYDETGQLVDGAIAGHPWDRADELSTRRLAILELLLTRPALTRAEVARILDLSRRTVDRVSELTVELRTDPEWVDRAHAALARFRVDEENPTALALELSIIEIERNKVSLTHPAVVAMAVAA